MTRLLLSSVAAVLLLAAPMAASAAPTTATKPVATKSGVKHVAAKPMMKPAGKHMTKAGAPHSRDSGSAAVDALNDQALARARAGQ